MAVTTLYAYGYRTDNSTDATLVAPTGFEPASFPGEGNILMTQEI